MSRSDWTPPNIPERRVGWETAYADVLDQHLAMPFEYGQSDCLLIAADLCAAMTGVDPMRGCRRYRSEAGAFKALFQLGFKTVEDALERVFPEIEQSQALRGDCGILVDRTGDKPTVSTLIVVQNHLAIGKSVGGVVTVPIDRLSRLFAIGGR